MVSQRDSLLHKPSQTFENWNNWSPEPGSLYGADSLTCWPCRAHRESKTDVLQRDIFMILQRLWYIWWKGKLCSVVMILMQRWLRAFRRANVLSIICIIVGGSSVCLGLPVVAQESSKKGLRLLRKWDMCSKRSLPGTASEIDKVDHCSRWYRAKFSQHFSQDAGHEVFEWCQEAEESAKDFQGLLVWQMRIKTKHSWGYSRPWDYCAINWLGQLHHACHGVMSEPHSQVPRAPKLALKIRQPQLCRKSRRLLLYIIGLVLGMNQWTETKAHVWKVVKVGRTLLLNVTRCRTEKAAKFWRHSGIVESFQLGRGSKCFIEQRHTSLALRWLVWSWAICESNK